MRRPRPLPWLAAGAFACLALAGCSAEFSVGDDSGASGEELANEIQDDYADQTGIGLTRITCEDVSGDEGERFSCTGRNERSVQLEIEGKVTDASSDGFDYSWEVVEAVAPGVLYERALRRELEDRGVSLSDVRCPLEVEVEPGDEIACSATDANGETRKVTLHLTDRDGGFDFDVAGGNSEARASTS